MTTLERTEAPTAACLNCGHALDLPRPNFCPACGQETDVRPPTLGAFLQQFGGAYLSTEGALWRTLKLLLLKPGELTRQYLAGRRKHFVLPLRLYLSVSVVTLLLVRLLAGIDLDISTTQGFNPKKAESIPIDFGHGHAGMKNGQFYCEGLPAWLCKKLQDRVDLDAAAFQRQTARVGERIVSNLGAAMFVALPSFALWLMLAYRNRRMRYTEHLVFALHVHAFWFVALLFTLPGWGLLTALALLTVPVYTLMAMKRVYGGRPWPRLLRAGMVSALYVTTLALALAGVALVTLLS